MTTQTKNWLESLKEEFEQALDYEDQAHAEHIIDYIKHQGFIGEAEELETELSRQSWFCDVCDGTDKKCVHFLEANLTA